MIDKAVQIFGGLGVTVGVPVESLYREIRALRIYEGASEVQKVVIARNHLAEFGHEDAAAPRLAAAQRLCQRHLGQGPASIVTAGVVGWTAEEKFETRRSRRPVPPGAASTRSPSSPRTGPGPSISCG